MCTGLLCNSIIREVQSVCVLESFFTYRVEQGIINNIDKFDVYSWVFNSVEGSICFFLRRTLQHKNIKHTFYQLTFYIYFPYKMVGKTFTSYKNNIFWWNHMQMFFFTPSMSSLIHLEIKMFSSFPEFHGYVFHRFPRVLIKNIGNRMFIHKMTIIQKSK